MNTLRTRYHKGLYAGASAGTLVDVAGVDLDVEWPQRPDVEVINDGSISIEHIVDTILLSRRSISV